MTTITRKTALIASEEACGYREEEVRRRAYELYEQRGKTTGYELSDWLQAESEIMADDYESMAA